MDGDCRPRDEGDPEQPRRSGAHSRDSGLPLPAAAEKIVKLVLVTENLSFRKTHDIDELVQLLPAGHPLLSDLHGLDRFTPFATAYRYPMDDAIPEPQLAEIAGWRDAIEGVRRKVVAFVAAARLGER